MTVISVLFIGCVVVFFAWILTLNPSTPPEKQKTSLDTIIANTKYNGNPVPILVGDRTLHNAHVRLYNVTINERRRQRKLLEYWRRSSQETPFDFFCKLNDISIEEGENFLREVFVSTKHAEEISQARKEIVEKYGNSQTSKNYEDFCAKRINYLNWMN